MTSIPKSRADHLLWTLVALVLLASPASAGTPAGQAADQLAGRLLSDALGILEAAGLRIVFTSELVTPDMRVGREPKGKTPKDRLIEVLEPHELGIKDGPELTIIVVRKPRPARGRPAAPEPEAAPRPEQPPAPDPAQALEVFRTDVTVRTDPPEQADLMIGSSRQLRRDALSAHASRVGDDPVRTLQALPGVGTGGDFRNDISVRASAFHHAALVIEGTPAPWLQHMAVGRPEASSLTMLRTDVVQEASLSVGAYARRDASQLGPQITIALREGSREDARWVAETSDWAAAATGEGPIGTAKRGSWLIGLRKSYTEWPLKRSDHAATVFGFGDLQSKLVYDVRPGQQLSASFIAGVSNAERDDPTASTLWDGVNRSALATAALRSFIGRRTIVSQRVSFQTHTFENRDRDGGIANRGAQRSEAYRLDVAESFGRGTLEAGVNVRRTVGMTPDRPLVVSDDPARAVTRPGASARWWDRAGYLSLRWSPAQTMTLVSGARVGGSSLSGAKGVDRWLQIDWAWRPRWRLHGATGVAHQFAGLERMWQSDGGRLAPERAAYADLGVSHAATSSVRWNATVFVRRERNLDPWRHGPTDLAARPLDGVARGVDLVIERTSRGGPTGWVGYTFAVARYTDSADGKTFRADLDQRHVVSLAGFVPVGSRTGLGLTFRAGSAAPIPGNFAVQAGTLRVGSARNRVERPTYARLDVRAERRLDIGGRAVTAFAEIVNLLQHDNHGLANGVVVAETGEAIGFTEQLFSRLVTAGVRVGF
jgi:hypothetical protein